MVHLLSITVRKKKLTETGVSTGQQASAPVGMAHSSRWRETPPAIPAQQIGIIRCSGDPWPHQKCVDSGKNWSLMVL